MEFDPCFKEVFGPEDACSLAGVSWDARQTLLWPNNERIMEIAGQHGCVVCADDLQNSQCYAHWAAETTYAEELRALPRINPAKREFPAIWGECMRQYIKGALAARAKRRESSAQEVGDKLICALWQAHLRSNLWCIPDPEAHEALKLLAGKFKLGVVSNAEGDLHDILRRTGLGSFFDEELVLDSQRERVTKPEPEIFRRLCERMDEDPRHVIHIGNQLTFDVRGALAAGLRAALYDPLHLWDNYELPRGATRVRSLRTFAETIARSKRDSSRPRSEKPSPPPSP